MGWIRGPDAEARGGFIAKPVPPRGERNLLRGTHLAAAAAAEMFWQGFRFRTINFPL
jgi:hypothetical protein